MVGPRRSVIALVAGVAAAAGCPGSGPTPPTGPATGPTATTTTGSAADGPMADPAEYAIDRVSWAAGQAIFTRTGLGDPYRVGVPYPLYLALIERYPDLFGGDLGALAARYGMLARAADPTSDDRDVRAGLPVGLHLTDDPHEAVRIIVETDRQLGLSDRLNFRRYCDFLRLSLTECARALRPDIQKRCTSGGVWRVSHGVLPAA